MMAHYQGKVEIGPKLSLLDGIQAGRWLLQQGVRIHSRCDEGIEALRQYHYEFDEEKKSFGAQPAHDWSSHAADAFRYLACVAKVSGILMRKPEAPKPPDPIKVRTAHYGFTLDELFDDQAQRLAARKRI
jgi:hypothetical protein